MGSCRLIHTASAAAPSSMLSVQDLQVLCTLDPACAVSLAGMLACGWYVSQAAAASQLLLQSSQLQAASHTCMGLLTKPSVL